MPDDDRPDKQVMRQRLVTLAELIKRQGYDLVRPLGMEGYVMKDAEADCEFNPDRLDHIDRLIAELKANGVYTFLDVAAYRFGPKMGRNRGKNGMMTNSRCSLAIRRPGRGGRSSPRRCSPM